MNDSKFLKLLYAIICLMLCAFFGFGAYFIVKGVYGAGLIAVGIGLMGLGVALFLGTGLVFAVDDVSAVSAGRVSGKAVLSGKALMKNVLYTIPVMCGCRWFDNVRAELSASDVGFFVQTQGKEPVYVCFDDISNVAYDDSKFLLVGNFEYQMQFKQCSMLLTIDNKMKCKLFEKLLLDSNISFVDENTAKSVIADFQVKKTSKVANSGRRSLKSRK